MDGPIGAVFRDRDLDVSGDQLPERGTSFKRTRPEDARDDSDMEPVLSDSEQDDAEPAAKRHKADAPRGSLALPSEAESVKSYLETLKMLCDHGKNGNFTEHAVTRTMAWSALSLTLIKHGAMCDDISTIPVSVSSIATCDLKFDSAKQVLGPKYDQGTATGKQLLAQQYRLFASIVLKPDYARAQPSTFDASVFRLSLSHLTCSDTVRRNPLALFFDMTKDATSFAELSSSLQRAFQLAPVRHSASIVALLSFEHYAAKSRVVDIKAKSPLLKPFWASLGIQQLQPQAMIRVYDLFMTWIQTDLDNFMDSISIGRVSPLIAPFKYNIAPKKSALRSFVYRLTAAALEYQKKSKESSTSVSASDHCLRPVRILIECLSDSERDAVFRVFVDRKIREYTYGSGAFLFPVFYHAGIGLRDLSGGMTSFLGNRGLVSSASRYDESVGLPLVLHGDALDCNRQVTHSSLSYFSLTEMEASLSTIVSIPVAMPLGYPATSLLIAFRKDQSGGFIDIEVYRPDAELQQNQQHEIYAYKDLARLACHLQFTFEEDGSRYTALIRLHGDATRISIPIDDQHLDDLNDTISIAAMIPVL